MEGDEACIGQFLRVTFPFDLEGPAIDLVAVLVAVTDGTPKNARLGGGNASSMRFTPSAATLTTGGTALKWLGKTIESATAGLGVFDGHYEFNGGVIVMPGQLVFVCGSIAQTGLFSMSLTWSEFPLD